MEVIVEPGAGAGVALVTGAGSGIGEAIVRQLAMDGYAVAVNDLLDERAERVAATLRADGHAAVAVPGDVADEDVVDGIVESAISSLGIPEVLVNNAGIGDELVPTESQEVASWDRVMRVNLRSAYLCSRRVGAAMIGGEVAGRIVNLASILGLRGAPYRTAYGPAKAGIVSLTQVLAVEWAPHGIRVNAVAPGYVRTPMLEEYEAAGRADVAALERAVPLGRLASPSDIADAASFLVSPRARHITGTTLTVDGGTTIQVWVGDG